MMVDMGCPSSIDRNQASSVHSPAENVLRNEFALIPNERLTPVSIRCMFPLAYATKPIPVRVIVMLQPFVDETIGALVIKSFAHQLAHGKTGRRE